MTNARLRFRLVICGIVIAGIIAASYVEYHRYSTSGSNFIGSNGTLIALLFASYIAYLFQQRAKLAEDVRKWWVEFVSAKSEFFIYCDKSTPTEDDYLKAFYKLSTAMDNLRVVYRNVKRNENSGKGYYPFEQVRDIIDLAQSVSYDKSSSFKDRQKVKQAITLVFGSLRHAIQSEATSLTPDTPVLIGSKERDEYNKNVLRVTGISLSSIRQENKERL